MLFNGGRRLLLLLLCMLMVVCGVFRALRSEYLIVKTVDGIITPLQQSNFSTRQAALLYETVSKYQWPSALAFYEQGSSSFKDELEDTTFAPRSCAEQRHMCKKIKEFDSSLRAVWIPNSLYELFVLRYAFTLEDDDDTTLQKGVNFLHDKILNNDTCVIDVRDKYIRVIDASTLVQVHKEMLHEMFIHKRWWNRAIAMVTRSDTSNPWADIFLDINQFITSILNTNFCGKDTVLQALTATDHYSAQESLYALLACNQVTAIVSAPKRSVKISALVNMFEKDAVKSLNKEIQKQGKASVLKDNGIIARTLRLEIAAQRHNRALVFRGTSVIKHPQAPSYDVLDSTLCMPDYKPRSISYGNGLFAGTLYDTWGTPYAYMSQPECFGYGLLVNKLVTAKNSSHNLFFVPPLSTLHGIFAVGQFFHPRTKAVLQCGSCAEVDGVQHMWVRDALGLLTSHSRCPLEHEMAYLELLAKNAVILSTPAEGTSIAEAILKNNMQQVVGSLRT